MKFLVNGEIYENISKIGEGSYGKVYLVKDKKGKKYILKKAKNFDDHEKTLENFNDLYSEFTLLKEIEDCDNVVKTKGFSVNKASAQYIQNYEEGGDLFNYLSTHTITYKKCLTFAIQLAKAIKCFHDKNVYHLDLKSHNIVLDKKYQNLSIIDFGLSKKSKNNKCNQFFNSCSYMAPEIVKGERKEYECSKADIYSLGIIFEELLRNCAHKLASSDTYDFNWLIDKMTNKDPSDRPSINKVVYFIIKIMTNLVEYEERMKSLTFPIPIDKMKIVKSPVDKMKIVVDKMKIAKSPVDKMKIAKSPNRVKFSKSPNRVKFAKLKK